MNTTLMYAKYNQAANKTIYDLLDKMTNEDREQDRGSFYKSLSGLFRHIYGGTRFFLGLYKSALGGNIMAEKALSAVETLPKIPDCEVGLTEAQWRELKTTVSAIDAAYVSMAESIRDYDLSLPVKIDWFGGNPATVPLSFMLGELLVHNTHHRGQISQILDSMQIANDYSGIDVSFL